MTKFVVTIATDNLSTVQVIKIFVKKKTELKTGKLNEQLKKKKAVIFTLIKNFLKIKK